MVSHAYDVSKFPFIYSTKRCAEAPHLKNKNSVKDRICILTRQNGDMDDRTDVLTAVIHAEHVIQQ